MYITRRYHRSHLGRSGWRKRPPATLKQRRSIPPPGIPDREAAREVRGLSKGPCVTIHRVAGRNRPKSLNRYGTGASPSGKNGSKSPILLFRVTKDPPLKVLQLLFGRFQSASSRKPASRRWRPRPRQSPENRPRRPPRRRKGRSPARPTREGSGGCTAALLVEVVLRARLTRPTRFRRVRSVT